MKTFNIAKTLDSLNLRKLTKPLAVCMTALFVISMVSVLSFGAVQGATTTSALHTSGSYILDSNGNTVYLRGMGVAGFAPNLILWGNGAAEDTEMAYRVRANGWELATTDEKFTESTRASWQSLWKQYVWYGKGGHYIFHKDPASLNLIKMSPFGGFIAGILRSPGAYLLTHHTSFFLLPVHYTYKRFAWLVGFFDAHLNGYGHKIN